MFDFGIEVLDDDDKRFEGEVELRPMGVKMVPGGEIGQGTTIGELLDEISEEEYVWNFFFFFFFILFYFIYFIFICGVINFFFSFYFFLGCSYDWILGIPLF